MIEPTSGFLITGILLPPV